MTSTFRDIMQSVIQTGKGFFSRSESKRKPRPTHSKPSDRPDRHSALNTSLDNHATRNFFKSQDRPRQVRIGSPGRGQQERFDEFLSSKQPQNDFFESGWKASDGGTRNIKAVKITEEHLMQRADARVPDRFYQDSQRLLGQDNLLGKFFVPKPSCSGKQNKKKRRAPGQYNYGHLPALTPLHPKDTASATSEDALDAQNCPRTQAQRAPKSGRHLPFEWSMADFELGRPLGRGRFGHVYLAREKRFNLIVALKMMKIAQIRKDQSQFLLRRELEVQSKLSHPNILSCYGYFWDRDVICFVLEYASEGELFRHLKAQPLKRFSEKRAALFVKQIISAFKYLHDKDILHRDLKVGRLRLTRSPRTSSRTAARSSCRTSAGRSRPATRSGRPSAARSTT